MGMYGNLIEVSRNILRRKGWDWGRYVELLKQTD